jgi:hypothetical protein
MGNSAKDPGSKKTIPCDGCLRKVNNHLGGKLVNLSPETSIQKELIEGKSKDIVSLFSGRKRWAG